MPVKENFYYHLSKLLTYFLNFVSCTFRNYNVLNNQFIGSFCQPWTSEPNVYPNFDFSLGTCISLCPTQLDLSHLRNGKNISLLQRHEPSQKAII